MVATTILRNSTTATMNEPKARDPIWLTQAILTNMKINPTIDNPIGKKIKFFSMCVICLFFKQGAKVEVYVNMCKFTLQLMTMPSYARKSLGLQHFTVNQV